jgi:hypothetical protein
MKNMIVIAIVANCATMVSKYFIVADPQIGKADYLIPIFVWPSIWLFSIVIASKIKSRIISFENKETNFLENLVFLFCTPLPILLFFLIF